MNEYMNEAVAEATYGVTHGEGGPFGAVVVCDGKVVGRGHNRVISEHDPTAHAEVSAIRDAAGNLGRFDLSDCEIYTTCEPCPMCYGAIYWARIPAIHQGADRHDAAAIGFDDRAIYEDIARSPEDRDIPTKTVGREECLGVFKLWQDKEDRVPY